MIRQLQGRSWGLLGPHFFPRGTLPSLGLCLTSCPTPTWWPLWPSCGEQGLPTLSAMHGQLWIGHSGRVCMGWHPLCPPIHQGMCPLGFPLAVGRSSLTMGTPPHGLLTCGRGMQLSYTLILGWLWGPHPWYVTLLGELISRLESNHSGIVTAPITNHSWTM